MSDQGTPKNAEAVGPVFNHLPFRPANFDQYKRMITKTHKFKAHFVSATISLHSCCYLLRKHTIQLDKLLRGQALATATFCINDPRHLELKTDVFFRSALVEVHEKRLPIIRSDVRELFEVLYNHYLKLADVVYIPDIVEVHLENAMSEAMVIIDRIDAATMIYIRLITAYLAPVIGLEKVDRLVDHCARKFGEYMIVEDLDI
ncbi:hypothetical protein BU24DRAFT_478611 [Aaosphaeria arxii CBS 175.79]|uniref:Uncharacterized protein n=1 Tax=Aaosphaeria arxii CBS 175.79 TaxID=1450172 RepID=A0A6A5XX22_9PLEO|nr:uncharacterized protein BU24DRAFT_478611 [Aaosphaeria arxii CBS 175.79]KAF2017509.1 hypothetical protein BU24DRAFT_478611 [Aaosphaeria arxii CBS 175.79]